MFKALTFAALCASQAQAGTWTQLDYDFDTIDCGVAFTSATKGFIPYADSGTGVGVKDTEDGGNTWTHGTTTQYSALVMDAAASGPNNGIIGGAFDTQFSTDGGKTFSVTTGDKVVSQSAAAVRDPTNHNFFGVAGGDIRNGNGVGISTDGGATIKFFNISAATTLVRYAAYPSFHTWYVSAGEWPQTSEKDETIVQEISARIRVHKGKDGKLFRKYVDGTPKRVSDVGWAGQILKTVDGGQTFESQYTTTDFYFNDIDCADETHCCAVGESDTGALAGSRIVCTQDGKTWKQTLFTEGGDNSLLTVAALGAGEYWAGGGILESRNFEGVFPHSTNGGISWDNSSVVSKMYGNAMSFPDAAHGWATTFDRDDQSGVVRYA